jgi:outer membrane protein OmpA-like peptidoglycan-associated protein
MSKAIAAGDWNKTFDLQGLSFDNSGMLAASAKSKVQEIASVLSRTPNARIQITGYGDTDEAALNQANGIKAALASGGVAADRITTAGQTGTHAPSITLMQ